MGRPAGKKPLTASDKLKLRKQQEAAAKQSKPLTRGAKKLTGAELLPYQHGRLPFEGRFNELVDKVASALSPKQRTNTSKQKKDLQAADIPDTPDSEAEEWADRNSLYHLLITCLLISTFFHVLGWVHSYQFIILFFPLQITQFLLEKLKPFLHLLHFFLNT